MHYSHETRELTSVFEQYDDLLRQIREQRIEREEILRQLAQLMLDFPLEGVEELVETVKEIHEFHHENSLYQQQGSNPAVGKTMPISGSYMRPVFTVEPDEE